MTTEQFETIAQLLKDIKSSIESLKGKENDKNKYDLSDIYNELDNVTRAVGSVESVIDNIKK